MKDEEHDSDEVETPLKKRLRRKRERGCDNNTSLSLGSPTSKKVKEEEPKVCLLLLRGAQIPSVFLFVFLNCLNLPLFGFG